MQPEPPSDLRPRTRAVVASLRLYWMPEAQSTGAAAVVCDRGKQAAAPK